MQNRDTRYLNKNDCKHYEESTDDIDVYALHTIGIRLSATTTKKLKN